MVYIGENISGYGGIMAVADIDELPGFRTLVSESFRQRVSDCNFLWNLPGGCLGFKVSGVRETWLVG